VVSRRCTRPTDSRSRSWLGLVKLVWEVFCQVSSLGVFYSVQPILFHSTPRGSAQSEVVVFM